MTGAKAADGVIHLAFIHDFSNYARAAAVDRAAIEAMGEVMAGTGKPLVIASGTLGVPKGILATEDTEPERNTPFADRALSADLVYTLSTEKKIRGSVIRLTATIHDGYVTYVGDGSARWPAVHRLDASVLFRLALEKGTAGATYNAVAEEGVSMNDIMTVIGKHLQLPVKSKSLNDAVKAIGLFGHLIDLDNPTSSEKTQRELEWHPSPRHPELLADLEANYFS